MVASRPQRCLCSLGQLSSLQNEGQPGLQVRINKRLSGTEGSGSQPASPMQSWHATPHWPAGTASSSSQAGPALDPIVAGQPAGTSASPMVGLSPCLAVSRLCTLQQLAMVMIKAIRFVQLASGSRESKQGMQVVMRIIT